MKRAACEICGQGERYTHMCRPCGDAYERKAHGVGDVIEAIVWAARRARWYAQRGPR